MDRFRIPVLRILNQEHHQKSDDGRTGIDDQLPRIGKMKSRAGQRPDCDDENRAAKCPGVAEDGRCSPGEGAEGVLDATEEVALVFLSLTLFGLLGDITLPSRFD
jgi:hypothetical protein